MYQSSSLYGFSFYIDYHHYQFYDQVWSWGFCAVEQLTSSLQISERKLDWQVDLTKPTPLQIKLQPMSFNLKSRFGHRRVAVDLIVEVGGGATSLAVDFSLVNLSAQQLLWDPLYPTVLDICWPFKRVHSPRSQVFFLIRTRKKPGWGTGLNNDDTTMWQFVLSYTVPAALNKTKWPSIYRSI